MLEDMFVIFNSEEGPEFGIEINWHLGPAATIVSAQSAYIHRIDPVPSCQQHMETLLKEFMVDSRGSGTERAYKPRRSRRRRDWA
jgi:hypothetical protein